MLKTVFWRMGVAALILSASHASAVAMCNHGYGSCARQGGYGYYAGYGYGGPAYYAPPGYGQAPSAYYLPPRFYDTTCADNARNADPGGQFARYPCWARESFVQGRNAGSP